MSEEKQLSAKKRTTDFGSAGSRRLLRSGRIPAVIYGKNDPVHVSLDAHEFNLKMRHFSETALLSIKVGSKEYECLMKDYQEDLMRDLIKHVDFYEVTRGQMLRTMVEIVLDGNPVGVRAGGVLDQVLYEVEIECYPKDLPEALKLDISTLELNHSMAVKDLQVPQGVKILDDSSKTIASVKTVKEEAVATEATEEPEVISDVSAESASATDDDKAKK